MEMSSRPARGGWIEIMSLIISFILVRSRPARGGWIEILKLLILIKSYVVPPRTGRVD